MRYRVQCLSGGYWVNEFWCAVALDIAFDDLRACITEAPDFAWRIVDKTGKQIALVQP